MGCEERRAEGLPGKEGWEGKAAAEGKEGKEEREPQGEEVEGWRDGGARQKFTARDRVRSANQRPPWALYHAAC